MLGPKNLTDAQVGYWENVFARTARTPEWKQGIEKNLLTEDLMGARESRKFIEAKYRGIAAIVKEIGLVR